MIDYSHKCEMSELDVVRGGKHRLHTVSRAKVVVGGRGVVEWVVGDVL